MVISVWKILHLSVALSTNSFKLTNISAACFGQSILITFVKTKRNASIPWLRFQSIFLMEESNLTSDSRTPTPFKESGSSISECDDSLDLVFLLLNGMISVFILLGNGLACFIFLKNKHFRRCFMNTFLVSLGLADIFMALLIMPGHVIFCASSCSHSVSEHCWLISSTKYLVFPATKLNLLAISYDRYIAVMQPLQYKAKISFKRVLIIITTVWTIPVILTLSRLAWWIKLPRAEALITDRVFNSCLIFLLVVLPVSILTVVNLRIILEIRKHRSRPRPANEESVTETQLNCTIENNDQRIRQAARKGTMACVLVVLIFVLCWLPRAYYNVARLLGKGEGPLLNKLSLFFLFVQSAVNPFVYTFYRVDFRRAAVRLVKCG